MHAGKSAGGARAQRNIKLACAHATRELTHTLAHARTRTHAHAHARTRTHTHAHTSTGAEDACGSVVHVVILLGFPLAGGSSASGSRVRAFCLVVALAFLLVITLRTAAGADQAQGHASHHRMHVSVCEPPQRQWGARQRRTCAAHERLPTCF